MVPIYGKEHVMLIDILFSDSEKNSENYTHVKRERLVLTAESSAAAMKGEQKTIWIKAVLLYEKNLMSLGTIESIRDITDFRKTELEIEK